MTVYVIADVKVTDDGWVPAYAASVHDVVHKHGGGAAGAPPVDRRFSPVLPVFSYLTNRL